MSQNIDFRGIFLEKSLDELYAWIDLVPLSRAKKNISRDFSDAVLLAEIIAYFAPRIIELHNYNSASSVMQKKINWSTLNRKVLPKLGLKLSEAIIQDLSESKPGAVEKVLMDVRKKLEEFNSTPVRRATTAQVPTSRSAHVRRRRPSTHVPSRTSRASVDNLPFDSKQSIFYRAPGTNATPSGALEYVGNFPSLGYRAQSDDKSVDLAHLSMVLDPTLSSLAPVPVSSVNYGDSTTTSDPNALSQTVYKGHGIVPQAVLDEKDREIQDLQVQLKIAENKVLRIEALVNLKEKRIADLSFQLHEAREKPTTQRNTRKQWIGMEN